MRVWTQRLTPIANHCFKYNDMLIYTFYITIPLRHLYIFVLYLLRWCHKYVCGIFSILNIKSVFSTVWTSLDVDVEVRFPFSTVPAADMFRHFKLFLKELLLPQDITASLKITDVAFTTGQDLCLFVCFALCLILYYNPKALPTGLTFGQNLWTFGVAVISH